MTLVALRWSDIKVFYLKCQPLPFLKRSLPAPFFQPSQMSFFNRGIFSIDGLNQALDEEGQVFALRHVSVDVEVYFAATAIFLSL